MNAVLAVDVGGHNIRALLCRETGEVLGRKSVSTDRQASSAETNVLRVVGVARSLLEETSAKPEEIAGIGIGVPGPVNQQTGVVSIAPGVPFWSDLPLRAMFEQHFPFPVYLDNDVNLAAVGEFWKGAARGCSDFVFIAMGTGIGSGVFVGGRLHRGKRYTAGEIGYMVIAANQRQRRIGEFGWLESVAGGLALDLAGRKAARENPQSALNRLAASPTEINSAHLFEAAFTGDRVAKAVLDEALEYLGLAVFNITAVLDPDLIILGGGVSAQGPRLLGAIAKATEGYGLPMPKLQLSELGDQAQILGAAFFALSQGNL